MSPKKAHIIRHKKGEAWIPYGQDSCYKAIIISYLYSDKNKQPKEQRKKRLKKLKSANFLNMPTFTKKSIELTIEGNDNISNKEDENDYIAFTKKNQTSFDHFLYNMNFKSKVFYDQIRLVSKILKKRIQIYSPCKTDLSTLEICSRLVPSKEKSSWPPIRILEDSYVHKKERNDQYKEDIENNRNILHYRALLSDPAGWQFSFNSSHRSINQNNSNPSSLPSVNNNSKHHNKGYTKSSNKVFNNKKSHENNKIHRTNYAKHEQGHQNSNSDLSDQSSETSDSSELYEQNQIKRNLNHRNTSNQLISQSSNKHYNDSDDDSVHLYNIKKRENNIENTRNKQADLFEKVSKDLLELVTNTLHDFRKGLNDYHIEKVKKCSYIYKEAEESDLLECLSQGSQQWPTYKQFITEITDVYNLIIEEVKKVDFTSQDYQSQSKNHKLQWFTLLNKKIYFALGVSEEWPALTKGRSSIKQVITKKTKDLQEEANKIMKKKLLNEKSCAKLNNFFQTYEIFSKKIEQNEFSKLILQLKKTNQKCINYLCKKAENIKRKSINHFDDYENLGDLLIETNTIEKGIDKAYIDGTGIEDIVKNTLSKFKKKHGNESVIKLNALAVQLRKNPKGGQIVAENSVFKGVSIMLRNTAFNSIGLDGILRDIREYIATQNQKKEESIEKSTIDQLLLNNIKKAYNEFKTKYWDLVESNLANPNATKTILSVMKQEYIGEEQEAGDIEWTHASKQLVPDILAYIFAYWTLRNVKYYKEAKGIQEKDRKKYLLQPHPAQIVAIIRILGLGKKGNLSNHLIQIGTGEGKSVVAFATSVTLALLGFDVSCVCYSEYLSLRDHNEFMPLIQELGVGNYIRYTTFNNLCEAIINEEGDIRDRLVNLVKNTSQKISPFTDDGNIHDSDDEKKYDSDDSNNNPTNHLSNFTTNHSPTFTFSPKRARIIFIDEVDVFFNEDFYGSPYSPTALLQHPSIQNLLELIWDKRQTITYHQVKSSTPYKECIKVFNKWEPIINEAVKNMIADVNSFTPPQYTIHNNNLCYQERDGLSSKVSYQYKTTFACFYEKQSITKENLEKRLGIYLNCGVFSYAEVPYEFDRILGVTGTLDSLGSVELSILKNGYDITEHTYMPSLYGASKRKFFKKSSIGLKIIEKEFYPGNLKKEIEKALQGTSQKSNDKRAVIVFFETPQKLDELYNNEQMEVLKENIMIMKSDLSFEEKTRCIMKATSAGNITFCIKEFGRGTDFVCYDQTVNHNGGVHVIITFFPENISEETQIVGRTGRQRNEGSVSMLLEEERLERFISKTEIDSQRNQSEDFYTLLNERRNEAFASNYQESIKYVDRIREDHKKAIQFTQALISADINKVTDHLLSYNKSPASDLTHTIILVDATGSMQELLSKAKKSIGTMFNRMNKVLLNQGKSNTFALQFAAYRNYNAPPDKLLQVSSWESRAENLIQFMENIEPEYGCGNEAIEIGFAHVLREHESKHINQVILIGDMPPNTKDDISYNRSHYINWNNEDPFYQAPHYEESLEKIKEQGIPVHAFHVPLPGSDNSYLETETAFTKIATTTGGSCELLKIHSDEGAQQLTDIVSEEVLRETGGEEAVKLYNKMFGGKSYL